VSNKKTALMTVPVGRPLATVLDVVFAADQTPLLSGGTGVGKSTQLEVYALGKGWEFRARDLSLMEPPDLVGLPKLDGKVTRYLPPSFLPVEPDGEGLLDLEEINRAPAYMRAPCLQLLTTRTLNDYALPAGWRLAAAINPAEDGYAADDLDPALESRFVRINVVASPDEWAAWARERKVDRRVIDYVLSDPTVFDVPMSNPRAWTAVARIIKAADKLETAAPLLRAAVAGCVGAERAAAFLRFMKDKVKPLDADAVLATYKKLRPVLRKWVADGKLDLVQGTLLQVKKRLQSRTEYEAARGKASAWRNLGRLLADLPGDLREDAEEFFKDRKYDVPCMAEGAP
jgi:MoxR-like ATPase